MVNNWQTSDMADQTGRIIVITGANSGLGFEETLALVKKNATVILACRNPTKAEQASARLRAVYPAAHLDTVQLDLSDLDSVRAAAAHLKAAYARIDVLINNAGIMVPPLSYTKQGFESQWGTNYLGHFLWTHELLPLVARSEDGRVVSMTSLAARLNVLHLDDPNYEKHQYRRWPAYGASKLAILMFTRSLAAFVNANGLNITVTAAHPGGAATNLQRSSSYFMKQILTPMISQSPASAARPALLAATGSDIQNGTFWGPAQNFEMKGAPKLAHWPGKANNGALRDQLWQLSERETNARFEDLI